MFARTTRGTLVMILNVILNMNTKTLRKNELIYQITKIIKTAKAYCISYTAEEFLSTSD